MRAGRQVCSLAVCAQQLALRWPPSQTTAHRRPVQHGAPRIPKGTTISVADVTQLAGAAAVTALGGNKRYEVGRRAPPA